jgi:hypothetical protein
MLFRNLNLQVQFEDAREKFVPIRSNQLLALKTTPRTLEFLYSESNRQEACIVALGENVDQLVYSLIYDRERRITKGVPLADKPWIRIESIRRQSAFNKPNPSDRLAPEQNTIPSWLHVIDRGPDRWYLGADTLESFGAERRGKRMFLQYRPRISFIMEPIPGGFETTLDELKASNLDSGCCNKFSTSQRRYYVPGADLNRWKFQAITFERADLASQSQWRPYLDFVPDYDNLTPQQALQLGATVRTNNGGGGQDSGVSMD